MCNSNRFQKCYIPITIPRNLSIPILFRLWNFKIHDSDFHSNSRFPKFSISIPIQIPDFKNSLSRFPADSEIFPWLQLCFILILLLIFIKRNSEGYVQYSDITKFDGRNSCFRKTKIGIETKRNRNRGKILESTWNRNREFLKSGIGIGIGIENFENQEPVSESTNF